MTVQTRNGEDGQRVYLTTPLYYVNAEPHLGHTYTTVLVDTLARYHRSMGRDVFFLTGTDEHGDKIAEAAAATGASPQEYATRVALSAQRARVRIDTTELDVEDVVDRIEQLVRARVA